MQFAGLEKFKGQVLHTHEYRDPEPFKGQTVVVVGFGDCAIDAAVEISRINPKVGGNVMKHTLITEIRNFKILLHALLGKGTVCSAVGNYSLKTILSSNWKKNNS